MKYGIRKPIHKFFIAFTFMVTSSIISSCATVQFDENLESLKGKSLKEVDPSFWENVDTVSVYYMASATGSNGKIGDARGAVIDALEETYFGFGMRGFIVSSLSEKINSLVQSFHWKINEYIFEVLKKEMNLPKKPKISFFNEPFESYSTIRKPAAKHISIYLLLDLIRDPKMGDVNPDVALMGILVVTVASDETMKHLEKNESSPRASLGSPRSEAQLYSELQRIQMYPDAYVGSISKRTKFYRNKDWISEDGAFLERQLKSMLKDLVEGASKLFF